MNDFYTFRHYNLLSSSTPNEISRFLPKNMAADPKYLTALAVHEIWRRGRGICLPAATAELDGAGDYHMQCMESRMIY